MLVFYACMQASWNSCLKEQLRLQAVHVECPHVSWHILLGCEMPRYDPTTMQMQQICIQLQTVEHLDASTCSD